MSLDARDKSDNLLFYRSLEGKSNTLEKDTDISRTDLYEIHEKEYVQQVDHMRGTIENMRQEIEELQNQNTGETEKETIILLHAKLQTAETENHELVQQVKQLKIEAEELRRQNQGKEKDQLHDIEKHQSLVDRFDKLKKEYEAMQFQISELQSENTDLQSKLEQHKNTDAKTLVREGKFDRITIEQLEQVRTDLRESENLLQATQEQNKRVALRNKNLETSVKELKRKLQEVNEQYQRQINDLMNAERQPSNERENKLRNQVLDLEKQLELVQQDGQNRLEEMRQELRNIKASKKMLENQIAEWRTIKTEEDMHLIRELETKLHITETKYNTTIQDLEAKLSWYTDPDNQQLLGEKNRVIQDLRKQNQKLKLALDEYALQDPQQGHDAFKYIGKIRNLERQLAEKNAQFEELLIEHENLRENNANEAKKECREMTVEEPQQMLPTSGNEEPGTADHSRLEIRVIQLEEELLHQRVMAERDLRQEQEKTEKLTREHEHEIQKLRREVQMLKKQEKNMTGGQKGRVNKVPRGNKDAVEQVREDHRKMMKTKDQRIRQLEKEIETLTQQKQQQQQQKKPWTTRTTEREDSANKIQELQEQVQTLESILQQREQTIQELQEQKLIETKSQEHEVRSFVDAAVQVGSDELSLNEANPINPSALNPLEQKSDVDVNEKEEHSEEQSNNLPETQEEQSKKHYDTTDGINSQKLIRKLGEFLIQQLQHGGDASRVRQNAWQLEDPLAPKEQELRDVRWKRQLHDLLLVQDYKKEQQFRELQANMELLERRFANREENLSRQIAGAEQRLQFERQQMQRHFQHKLQQKSAQVEQFKLALDNIITTLSTLKKQSMAIPEPLQGAQLRQQGRVQSSPVSTQPHMMPPSSPQLTPSELSSSSGRRIRNEIALTRTPTS